MPENLKSNDTGKQDNVGNNTSPAQPKRVISRRGVVLSDKMDKTIVVRVDSVTRHPVYKKVMRRSRKIKAHDEKNTANTGDKVKIVECRPLSKDKRWRLVEVVEKAKV